LRHCGIKWATEVTKRAVVYKRAGDSQFHKQGVNALSRKGPPMVHQSDAMRAMAQKYLRLARSAPDAGERSKFFDYAMVYAQLSEQAERLRAASKAMAGADRERKDDFERGDVVARSRGR